MQPKRSSLKPNENNLILFGLALGITVMLVLMERCALWILGHHKDR
jgi:hypothetical protein